MHPSRTALSPLRSTLRNIPDMWRALNYTYSWDTITNRYVLNADRLYYKRFNIRNGGLHIIGYNRHSILTLGW